MIIRRRPRQKPADLAEDHGPNAAEPAARPQDDRETMRAEQMLALVGQARPSAFGNVVGAVFLIVALWQTSPSLRLAGWGIVMCLVSGLRARMLAPWQGRGADALEPAEVRYALRRAAIWIVAAGSLWGWAAVDFVPRESLAVFAAVIAGVAAVQAMALMVQPLIAAGYVLPALLPLALRFCTLGEREATILAVLIVLYAALLIAVARGGHAGFVSSILARRRSERLATDLAAAQSLLETTLENVDQGILMIDAEKRVPVCNLRAIELFGLPADLMTGSPRFEDVLRWQWANGEFDNAPEAVRRFMASGGVSTERPVYEHHRPNGTVLEIRSIPLPGGGAVHTYSDVTEPRAREADLRRAEAEYRSLFENAVVGVFRCDPEGRLLRVNTALARIAGYASETALLGSAEGKNVAESWYVDPARKAEFYRLLRQEGRVTDFVCEVRHKNGQSLWVSQNAWIVRNAHGEPHYIEGTILDVTERHQAEEALARALAAEEASRIKSEFLANMSHELRTPLNAIIGFSEMLEQEAFGPLGDARNGEYVGDILHSGRHLLAIVNDILDLAKIEAGHMELHFEELDVIEIIESCKRLLSSQAEASGVQLLADERAGPIVNGDPKRIRQILLNLVSNAVKFTPSGGTVAVTIDTAFDPLAGGEMAVIKVSDTGIGMSPEELKIALMPFRQVDSSRARRHEGTGLGLPLARRLVELHGGRFEIESVPGRGTTATMHLPALAVHNAETMAREAAE